MLKFFVLLSIVACTLSAVVPKGKLPQLDGRIVGGTATSILKHPHQISLQRGGTHSCGGSIFSHTVVVTAAHCVQNVRPADLSVRAGSGYWNTGGIVVGVKNFKAHPFYNANTMINDVAVIRLDQYLNFSDRINRIPLAQTAPATDSYAIVSGWGTTSFGSPTIPTQLREADVEIIRRAVCASPEYGYGSAIQETMICAAEEGKDACQGDSGGPLVYSGELVGIVSWGYGCARPEYPGVYAAVPSLRQWIIDAADIV